MKNIKKLFAAVTICVFAFAVSACGSSASEEETTMPDAAVIGNILDETEQAQGVLDPTDSTYSIPADAPTGVNGGPGMMETQPTTINPNFPEDKKYVGEPEEGTMVCLYAAANYGIYQLFEYVDVCDADSLLEVMIMDDILESTTEIVAFSNEGGDAVLELNELTAGYDSATEEQAVTCVANTFIENLGLNTIEIVVGDQTFGPMSFVEDYSGIN